MNFKKNTLILINRKVLATQLQGFFLKNFQENLFYIKSILEKVAVKNKKILNWFIKFLTSCKFRSKLLTS
ncbi:hypothetical protein B7715_00305 [Streptococcus oralis subsp. oralis]|uniref:Uncharacterized protein n=1 Tax=Streptococcus oralis subsp. oralis TaxID=1891914 RepID=A0A1X1I5A7_STROR|nr:hypothetical protein HMPREF2766_03990 [Streptococcus sp. HMSC076C08]OFP31738.1 hypothetical protein HMPREF2991_03430 [Streptococcus sp. HMSC072D07]OFR43303.1 hypothetical protein HMPREF2885_08770 [Streptococcus sp. HMSC062H02]OHQ20873.1 hypothetical protein HMPREF2655_08890 [Streptococcus sp. HMSC066F01]ORO59286.1 hypothetical protein B7716_07245 [Streptococcus oralis subsp. oralis]